MTSVFPAVFNRDRFYFICMSIILPDQHIIVHIPKKKTKNMQVFQRTLLYKHFGLKALTAGIAFINSTK